MTLLRRVMALPDPQFSRPRVFGVDDFATRRGHSYANVITDGEQHNPVDVLPGREATPLAAWLRAHPGAEVICRDRTGAHAEGAALGAPDALHVADRFPILQNLGQAVEKCVASHRNCLRTAVPPPDREVIGTQTVDSKVGVPVTVVPTGRRAERMRAHHALVHGLLSEVMGPTRRRRPAGLDQRRPRHTAARDQRIRSRAHHRTGSRDRRTHRALELRRHRRRMILLQ